MESVQVVKRVAVEVEEDVDIPEEHELEDGEGEGEEGDEQHASIEEEKVSEYTCIYTCKTMTQITHTRFVLCC